MTTAPLSPLPALPQGAQASASTAADAAVAQLIAEATKAAAPTPFGGNRPLLLTDPERLLLVTSGAVDLFSVDVDLSAAPGKASGTRQFIGRAEAGSLLPGMELAAKEGARPVAVLAAGGTDTSVARLDRGWLAQALADPALRTQAAAGIDLWLRALANAFRVDALPQSAATLAAGDTATLAGGSEIAADGAAAGRVYAGADAVPAQDVVWVRVEAGAATIGAVASLPLTPADGWFPLAQLTGAATLWLRAGTRTTISAASTLDLLASDALNDALAAFHKSAMARLQALRAANLAAAQAQLDARRAFLENARSTAASELAATLTTPGRRTKASPAPRAARPDESDLLAACRIIGEVQGIVFSPPEEAEKVLANREPLAQIAFASRVRTRRVRLESGWWRADGGPILGFREDGAPVALLPRTATSYEAVDPHTGERTRVDATFAETLQEYGTIFYRPLGEHAVSIGETVRFSLFGLRSDLINVALFGFGLALMGLLIPVATGWLVDTAIPSGRRSDLVALGIVLLAVAVASMLITIAQQFAILRIQTKSTAALSAAIWDRLLGLPAGFFRNYTAGDLANRAYGISMIRKFVGDATITAMVSGIFSLVNFGLLFYYSPALAWTAVALAILLVAVTVLASYRQLALNRTLRDLQGTSSGVVLQLLNGVTKIRVAGAEANALGLWAGLYARQQKANYRAGTVANALRLFESIYPLLSAAAIYAIIGYWLSGNAFSTGVFVSFNVAFGQFLKAAIKQVSAVTGVLQAIPFYERARPILNMQPEVTQDKIDPGVMSGRVDVQHVQFRYSEDGPLILRDITLSAEPGEMVALVGPSGAGKSTIIRMLLGFEAPVSGGVYYDNKDLQTLNVQAVRRQIGVVLQDGKVMPGTVYDNIVGASLLTEADAWEAARIAGLDADIRRMPMGMQTAIAEGGTTFSGGQLQRLMIARAVVGKPRILIFDEATSALDNETQATVTRNLDALQVTRIVIAHRLSTIVHARRIFVLEAGAIIQTGTYDELMAQEGLFRELVRRQLA